MIEFRTETHKRKIDIPDKVSRAFKAPVIFYLINKNDTIKLFYTFVIVDLVGKELTYISTYFPDNIALFEQSEEKELIAKRQHSNPHCSLLVGEGGFYTFMENTNFFLHIDSSKNTMRLYFGKDIAGLGAYNVQEFGHSCFKDDNDSGHFYFSIRGKKTEDNQHEITFFRANLDLSQIEYVFQTLSPSKSAPHMTRKFKDLLFSSEFGIQNFKINSTGKIFKKEQGILRHTYRELFREFCTKSSQVFSEELFMKNIQIDTANREAELSSEFKAFCDLFGNDWRDICAHHEAYAFTQFGGSIGALDLQKKEMIRYNTSSAPAAHIEVDQKQDAVYVSSHNFLRFRRDVSKMIHYLGPAHIDKFKIENGKLNLEGTFSNPNGYRFTSHRVFYHNGKSYVCTMGQPNRLFFIDAETMKTFYHYDLYEDILSGKENNLADFLNNTEMSSPYIAIEVSFDGEYVFIMGRSDILIYSFPERRLVYTIPFMSAEPFGSNISLKTLFNRTIHVNYLV